MPPIDAGLSSPGRLHDLFVTCEGVTPGEFKARGEGLTITYGLHHSPFGECLIARTERGICWLSFVRNGNRRGASCRIQRRPGRTPASSKTAPARESWSRAFMIRPCGAGKSPLPVLVKGTNFQIKVWEALLKIPVGTVVTYEDIALYIGFPKAVRAVGNAVGRNPISFVIPCHRVVRKTAEFGNYGGGPARKKAMIGWEAAIKAA